MAVKSYNFQSESADAGNWAVAQRMATAFAPQAQATPDMTVFLNKGWLLRGGAIIDVAAHSVGPFAPTAQIRVDRIVVDRTTGASSIVTGTEGSSLPATAPAGTLPVARVVITAGMTEITNAALTDERIFVDQTSSGATVLGDNLTALSEMDATPGLLEQTGPATFVKRALGAAAAGDVPTRADADARYLRLSGGMLTGDLTLAGNPDTALKAVPKQYVDQEIADLAEVAITGAGLLTGGGDLTADRVITIADVAQNTVLGRIAPGAGAPSSLSVPMIAVATAADAQASRAVLGLGDSALRDVGTANAANLPTLGDADARYLQLAGGTLAGDLTLAGNPDTALMAAPKQYVDQEIADLAEVAITGAGLLTGGGDLTADRVITMVDVAQNTVLGRIAPGAGAPSSLSVPMIAVAAAADAQASRAVLGLGDSALRDVGTADAANLPTLGDADARYLQLAGGTLAGELTLDGDPTQPLHAVPKQYVDNLAAGLDVKASVRVASVGELVLCGEQNVDDVAVTAGDRVLVKNQSDATENGLYVVAADDWTRSADADAWERLPGAFVFVEEGAANADTGWVCAADRAGALEVDEIVWSQFTGVGAFAPLNRQILAGTGLTGGGALSADRTLALADTAVTAGSYGSASQVATFEVDAQGRLIAANEVEITPAAIGAQAHDADLDALADLTESGLLVRSGDGAAATRTMQGAGVITVADGDGVAGDPVVSTSMQSGRLLGRTSSGEGEVEEITLGVGLTLASGELSAVAAGTEITQSGPTYLASGASTSLTGKSVLAVYEQTPGPALNVNYNTPADYQSQSGIAMAGGGASLATSGAGGAADGATKLLIHADGLSGSTEIIDQRGITPFGTHCAYFDGTAYFTAPSSYKVAFGASQNYTIEGWFRPAAIGAQMTLFDFRTAEPQARPMLYISSGGNLNLWVNGGIRITSSTLLTADVWRHVALTRGGGVTTLYIDGVANGSWTDATNYPASQIVFGKDVNVNGHFFTGWMDEFRISKAARYTGNFTPHTSPHVRDADTVYLFHFDDGHGAQFIRDDSRSGHEIEPLSSSTITALRAKFGTASWDGAFKVAASKSHADFSMGAENFTVSAWVYPTAWPTSDLSLFDFSASAAWSPSITCTTTGALRLNVSNNNSAYNLVNAAAAGQLTLNAWNNVVWTRDGATMYVFVNGIVQVAAPVGAGVSVFFNPPNFCVNRSVSGLKTITGQIDEVLVKRGVAEWTANFTPPTAPHVADDRTVLLLHFDGANGDKVTLDSSESSYGGDQFGDATIPMLTFQNGAALSAAQTRGGHATSLALNGTNQCASIAFAQPGSGHPLYFAPGESFCIEGWSYVTSVANTPHLFGFTDGGSNNELNLRLPSGGGVEVGIGPTILASGPSVNLGAWNHLAVVRDGRGWTVYVNGVAGATANPTTWMAYSAAPYTAHIGAYRGNTQWLNGAIDSFRVTHGKPRYTANFTPGNLTQDDDTALLWEFNGSVGQKWVKELSKNTALIAATNARTVEDGVWIAAGGATPTVSGSQSKFGGSSAYFNSGAYAALPARADWLPGSGAYTVEAWVRPTALSGVQGIIGNWRESNFADSAWLLSVYGGNYVAFLSNGTAAVQVNGLSAAVNTWAHVALVCDGVTARVFVNGVAGTPVAFTTFNAPTTQKLWLGAMQAVAGGDAAQNHFSGYLDELRVSKGVARWTADFAPPAIPYGQTYQTGPFWIATKPGVSALDLSAFSSIDSAAATAATPPGTSLKFLISTDDYATALKRWNGSTWVDTPYSMNWNGAVLTTSATAADLDSVANSAADLQTGLAGMNAPAAGALNIVALLATSNPSYAPSLDNLAVVLDQYTLLRPGTDYAVVRKKVSDEQSLMVTRVKSGSANHVFDVV